MTGQQSYDVAERRDGFELRRYPAHLVAEIEVAGSFDEAPIRAFGPLAGYVNGATRSRRSGREPRRPRRSCIRPPADPAVSCRLRGYCRPGAPVLAAPAGHAAGNQAVTACLVSLLVTWMLRGLAASRTGMVRVSTPAA